MADGSPRPDVLESPGLELCDRCGHAMEDIHCRLVCFNCGYQRDCSDP